MNQNHPNVLFIAIDDLNSWLGCLGTNPDVKTPNIDRLASEGMLFTNACCPSPVCNPSRTSILTGLRPYTTGCYLLPDDLELSPERRRTKPFPLYFRHHGYKTITAGKVDHDNGLPVETATRASWGESNWEVDGGLFGGQQFDLHSRYTTCLEGVGGWPAWATHWGPLDDDQAETLSDVKVTAWTLDQLRKKHDRPFLLAAGFFRPHLPTIAPKRFFDMYDKKSLHVPPNGPYDFGAMPPIAQQIALTAYQDLEKGTHRQIVDHGYERDMIQAYLACISFTDDCIGRVLRALEESEYAENTIVMLWSDNGYSMGEHFHWRKWSLWDQGARVPLIIKAPGVTTSGSVCNEAVSLTDLYPTLLELTGLPHVDELEGESLVGLLSGRQTDRETPAVTSFGPHNHSARTREWRYTRYADGSQELYHYPDDPHEHVNLVGNAEHRDVLDRLSAWIPDHDAPALASVPDLSAPILLEPGEQRLFFGMQPGAASRSITVRARVRADGDGVIVHHGSWFAGYALYIRDGHLAMAVMDVPQPLRWDTLEPQRTIVTSDDPLPDREVAVEGVLGADGSITLRFDGDVVGRGTATGPLSIYPAGRLEAGHYTGTKYPAIGEYAEQERFPGTLSDVSVRFGQEV